MLDIFLEELHKIYLNIREGECTQTYAKAFKDQWCGNGNTETMLGDCYQKLCKKETKKSSGSFYTPSEIVAYMTSEALEAVDLAKTPDIRILDPSCGGGYFLIEAFGLLMKKAGSAGITQPERHILTKNLFGCDLDETAVEICIVEFFILTGILAGGICTGDFLLDDFEEVDFILGNPPYMGHKQIEAAYRQKLTSLYDDVFYDKGDLSYCFIKKAIGTLKNAGRLLFITSRYMLEAQNGEGVRRLMLRTGHLQHIVDFYGIRLIKGAGVDNMILDYIKGDESVKSDEAACGSMSTSAMKETVTYRFKKAATGQGMRVFEDIQSGTHQLVDCKRLNLLNQSSGGFSFLSEEEEQLLNKIVGLSLSEIAMSSQGIISGCDGAFILTPQQADFYRVEKNLLFPWIKSSAISQYSLQPVESASLQLIYSNLMHNVEEDYPNALTYISRCRERLEERRECKNGVRKWYELQWGRTLELFLGRKLIFPYKSTSNRFAIDEGNCFSADVYSITIKPIFESFFSYEYLAGILNSSLYEFYIKSMAKKLGEDLYDYYPNKVMTLRIPEGIPGIEDAVIQGGIHIKERIDHILSSYYCMTGSESEILRKWCE